MAAKPSGAPADPPSEVVALLKDVRRRLAGAAGRWTLEQWHDELVHLRSLSVRHDLGLHQAHPAVFDGKDGSVGVIGPWPTVVRVDPPPPLKIGDTAKGRMLVYPDRSSEAPEVEGEVVGPPLVYPDQPGEPCSPEALQQNGFLLPWEHTPALVISLVGAPEEHIRAKVMAALEEALRERAASERRAGSRLPRMTSPDGNGFSRPFADRTSFTKWRSHDISELAELLAWKAKLPEVERRKYPEHKLGSWVFNRRDAAQKTSVAKNVLRDAIACIPLMLAEQLDGVPQRHLKK